MNEQVTLQEPQVPPEPHELQLPPMPQALFVEGHMTNVESRSDLINLTQLMMTQAYIVNNHFVGQANQGDRP